MKSPKCVQTCRANLESILLMKGPDGSIFVVIQDQQELVSFSLSTSSVQLQLIALLALEDCLLEGGTDRKGNSLDSLKVVRYGKIRFVSTEGDE